MTSPKHVLSSLTLPESFVNVESMGQHNVQFSRCKGKVKDQSSSAKTDAINFVLCKTVHTVIIHKHIIHTYIHAARCGMLQI